MKKIYHGKGKMIGNNTKPQFIECQRNFRKEKIMDYPKLNKINTRICHEFDKTINGFMIPFEADNNEDYEKKLKDK